ncbi:MAG: hypothetical protein AMXMBFR58_29760 [Phycisphaerae bacterium]
MTTAPTPPSAPTCRTAYRIKLDTGTHEFARLDDARPLIASLYSAYKTGRDAHREHKLRLGRAIVQLRGQIPFGAWGAFCQTIGLSRKTIWACSKIAEAYSTHTGEFLPEAVSAMQRELAGRGVKHRLLSVDPAEMTASALEDLLDLAKRPEQQGDNSFTEGNKLASASGTRADQPEDEVEWSTDDDDELDDGSADGFVAPAEVLTGKGPSIDGEFYPEFDEVSEYVTAGEATGASGEQLSFDALYAQVTTARDRIADLAEHLGDVPPGLQSRLSRAIDHLMAELAAVTEGC